MHLLVEVEGVYLFRHMEPVRKDHDTWPTLDLWNDISYVFGFLRLQEIFKFGML